MVLNKKGRYTRDSYRGYYSDSSLGILGQSRVDNRLQGKEFVVGVTVGSKSKAYSFRALNETPVVNDSLNGTPLLVTFEPSSATGSVFNPVVRGRLLKFRRASATQGFRIADLETGTSWDPVTGKALEGPLAGETLQRVASHYEFWFAWKDFRPDTELYQGAGGRRSPLSLLLFSGWPERGPR